MANTPIMIPAISPLDRPLLLPPPDAEPVEAETGGMDVDVDVGYETVRREGDNELVVPTGEFVNIFGVSEVV